MPVNYRLKNWNESLAEHLRDPEYARAFYEACLEEGIEKEKVIEKMALAGIPAPQKIEP